ncbi:MAG: beta-phosphoglucomutase [Cytophagia bacterium]|nr:MAG: beta-phosphoglucomutase [Cytophagales bacterium]TAG04804.1 MAG: beta-phosphoglucomutase [Cytophagia bacterium]TAG38938.1 MAG: beta-phosphoglucomutase [Cytophagia bacterium]TAH30307.1 MAG: beta-phosphoglucomutase [Cytophagales bacterium]
MLACLFDLDGVIVDTAKYHFLAWKRLASAWNFDLTEEQNEHLKGVSRTESLEIILKLAHHTLSKEAFEEALQIKNEWFLDFVNEMNENEILEGVTDFLHLLKQNKIVFSLASSSKNAKNILQKIGLFEQFDAIVDGNDIINSKPDPEIFEKAAKKLNTDTKKCIVFEDAVAGVEAGKRAGMKVIGIGDKEVLKEADIVVKNLKELTIKDLENLLSK